MSTLYIPQLHIPNQKPMLGELPNLAHPSRDGLVARYLFNEGGGSTIYDDSGYGNSGTFVGDPQWVSSSHGPAVDLDGTGDCINCGTKANVSGDLSVIARINPSGNYTSYNHIINKRSGASNTFGLLLNKTDGFVRFAASSVITTSVALSSGVWSHLAITLKDGNLTFYLNGVVFRDTDTGISIPNFPDSLVLIGGYWNTEVYKEFFFGSINNTGIYDRALSSSEIQADYLDGYADYQPDPIIISSAGGGTEYQELLLDVSCAVVGTKSGIQQMSDLLKTSTLNTVVTKSDTKQMSDLLKDVSFAASVDGTDIRTFLETGLAVSLAASVTKTETSQMVDLLKAISFSSSVSKTETSQMVDLNKPIAFAASISGTDIRVFLETGLQVSFSASATKTDTQQMLDLLKSATVVSSVSASDIQQMLDTGLSATFVAVGDIGVEIYIPASGVVNAVYGFVVIRQTTNN